MTLRLAFLLLCLPALARAGEPAAATDLSAALQRAKVGTTLRIDGAGAPVVGRYQGIGTNGLELRQEQGRISIPLESVQAVSRLDSARGKGILWGALIGAGAGAAVASVRVDDPDITDAEHDWLTYTYHTAVGALIGGAIGGVIGSAFNSWQPVYP